MSGELSPVSGDSQGLISLELDEITKDLSVVADFVDLNHEISNLLASKIVSGLRKLADERDKVERDVRIADIVGNSVGIAGSVITIGSIAAAPFTAGLSTLLFIGGTASAAAGGLTSIGAMVTSMLSTNQTVKEAKVLLDELDTSTSRLAHLYRQASEALERLTFKFLQFDYWSQELENILNAGQISEKEIVNLVRCFISKLPNKKDLGIAKLPENFLGVKRGFEAYINLLRNPILGKQAQQLCVLTGAARTAPGVVGDVTKIRTLFKGTPIAMSATERALGGIFAGATILFSVVNIVQIAKSDKETVAAAQVRKIASDLEDYFKSQ